MCRDTVHCVVLQEQAGEGKLLTALLIGVDGISRAMLSCATSGEPVCVAEPAFEPWRVANNQVKPFWFVRGQSSGGNARMVVHVRQ
jgi:hypothetical protein